MIVMSIIPLIYIWSMPLHLPSCLGKGKRLPTNKYKLDPSVETETVDTTLNGACCDFFDTANDHRNSTMPYSVSMFITTTHATAFMAGSFFFPCLFMW